MRVKNGIYSDGGRDDFIMNSMVEVVCVIIE